MIKVKQRNSLVFTNIFYCKGEVRSVINIDRVSLALLTDNGI